MNDGKTPSEVQPTNLESRNRCAKHGCVLSVWTCIFVLILTAAPSPIRAQHFYESGKCDKYRLVMDGSLAEECVKSVAALRPASPNAGINGGHSHFEVGRVGSGSQQPEAIRLEGFFQSGFEGPIIAENLSLELIWNTPGDPDQGDSNGADLDLALRHQSAMSWEDPVWVCSWRNPNPDWGVLGDPSDDPVLDIDDTDGLGPERINFAVLELGVTYNVGVHYWDDHGFGASTATARLYANDVLRAELSRELVATNYFWQVWDVESDNGELVITTVDIVTSEPPP